MSKNTLTMLLKKNRHELRTLLAYRCPDELLHGTTEHDRAFRTKLAKELKEVDFLIEQLKQFRDGNNNLPITGAK